MMPRALTRLAIQPCALWTSLLKATFANRVLPEQPTPKMMMPRALTRLAIQPCALWTSLLKATFANRVLPEQPTPKMMVLRVTTRCAMQPQRQTRLRHQRQLRLRHRLRHQRLAKALVTAAKAMAMSTAKSRHHHIIIIMGSQTAPPKLSDTLLLYSCAPPRIQCSSKGNKGCS